MSLFLESQILAPPAAVFVGDFNTGKTQLINALLRRNLLFISREESLTPPVFVARSDDFELAFGARPGAGLPPVLQSHEQFLSSRQMNGLPCENDALAVLSPTCLSGISYSWIRPAHPRRRTSRRFQPWPRR